MDLNIAISRHGHYGIVEALLATANIAEPKQGEVGTRPASLDVRVETPEKDNVFHVALSSGRERLHNRGVNANEDNVRPCWRPLSQRYQ